MDIRRPTIAMISFNHSRQKQQIIQQQQQQQQQQNVPRRLIQTLSPPISTASAESQVANLQQCISAYLDSIQMVCRAGSWLSETLAFLLRESASGALAEEMKSRFSGMLQLSVSTTVQAKNELARILMELSLPNLNNNNQAQAIKDCKTHNAKVLEKCIYCLSAIHNSFFKEQIDFKNPSSQSESTNEPDNDESAKTPPDPNNNPNTPPTEKPQIDFQSEWTKLCDTTANAKSWFALKEHTGALRKYNGLTDTEIQNLLKGTESVSDLYLKKLNQKIDTALRNYEVGLRGLPSESVVIFGGFYSSPDRARLALKSCCSQMEMEQDIQRLPVSQFLHCELPLMALTVNKKDYPGSNSSNSSSNISQKKNAVSQLIQSTNQKLSISETDELTSEILGEICPARWRTHAKASLQLLYGNSGLVLVDTVSRESKNKQNAHVLQRDSFIVVSVLSTWCIKEDPGTMSLLQRNLDPEKTLATIHVRYVAVYSTKLNPEKRFEPGIFVEAFVQTGSQNRRKASQTLRASQSILGMPATPMSACWLTQQNVPQGSSVLLSRLLRPDDTETKNEAPGDNSGSSLKKSSSVKSEGGDSGMGSGSEKRRRKKIVVEIKSDTASEEEKSSDSEDSVRDVIHLLSGSSRRATRRRFQIEREAKEAETDEMSENIEKILDSDEANQQDKDPSYDDDVEMSKEKQTTPDKSDRANKPIPQQQHTRSKSDALQKEVSGEKIQHTSRSQSHPPVTTPTPPLPQHQTYMAPSPAMMKEQPFHQKSKSQTLPITYPNVQQNPTGHQFSKSMSNTLPQLRGGRNIPQQSHSNSQSHPYPPLPSKQALNLPNAFQQLQQGPNPMRVGMQPPDHPRTFLHPQFNPNQMQAYSSSSPSHTQPQPHTAINRSPGLQRHPFTHGPNPNLPVQSQQQYAINEPQFMMGPGRNVQQEQEAPMTPNMATNLPQYGPSSGDDHVQMMNPTGNVQALLQHFNKLAMGGKQAQTGTNENPQFAENITLQQLLMLGQNQSELEKVQQMQQNSNNNNMPQNTGPDPQQRGMTPCSNARWDVGNHSPQFDVNSAGSGLLPQSNIPSHHQMMGQSMTAPTHAVENNAIPFGEGLMQARFQQQMRLRQEMAAKEEMRSKSPNQMDQFVSPTQQGSLGPIGSPVIIRRRTNEMSPPMHHLTAQHQGSNTWPCLHELPIAPLQQSEGDAEYEQYVAEITRNSIQRKMMSQRSIDELEAGGKNNTWDLQSRESWNPSRECNETTGGSFSVFNTPDLGRHIRGCDSNFSGEENTQTITDNTSDASRTGTWPPWQLWESPGNGNLWNWSDDLLSAAGVENSRVENPLS